MKAILKNLKHLEECKVDIKIGHRLISGNMEPYFIADIAANHDGSLKGRLN